MFKIRSAYQKREISFCFYCFYIKTKKFALYFKWIEQVVYDIITNKFTQSFMSASLTHHCPSYFSLVKLSNTPLTQNSNHYNFFLIDFKHMFAERISVYI